MSAEGFKAFEAAGWSDRAGELTGLLRGLRDVELRELRFASPSPASTSCGTACSEARSAPPRG